MLAIRMQRTGRSGHAMFRVVVQDSRRTPTSGKVVAHLGSYDPHTKAITLDKEKAAFYLEHGAQPSDRLIRLLQIEGVKLPKWVQPADNKQHPVRHADKRRSTRPAEAAILVTEESPVEATEVAEPVADENPTVTAATTAESSETPDVVEEAVVDPPIEDKPAEPADESAPEKQSAAEPEVTTDEAPADTPKAE